MLKSRLNVPHEAREFRHSRRLRKHADKNKSRDSSFLRALSKSDIEYGKRESIRNNVVKVFLFFNPYRATFKSRDL